MISFTSKCLGDYAVEVLRYYCKSLYLDTLYSACRSPESINLACRVFVPRDSLRLLSESWSLTDAAMGITVVGEKCPVTSLLRIPNPAVVPVRRLV